MDFSSILNQLPYSQPFLFVDKILEIDETHVIGSYTFPKDSFFYAGHFKNNPVTPGVILTECMAQIGVVCLGIYLLKTNFNTSENIQIALSSSTVDFYRPVFPGEHVKVVSQKEYFRFNKLKCSVQMFDSEENLVCKGLIAGMIKTPNPSV